MKYIKNISELKSSTYKSAADALKKHGHVKRVSALEDWAKKREIEEDNERKSQFIKRFKSIGEFKITFNPPGVGLGAFDIRCYLHLWFDSSMFEENYVDWIYGSRDNLDIFIGVSIIPIVETEEDIENYQIFMDMMNGRITQNSYSYSIGELAIHFGSMSELDMDIAEYSHIYRQNKYDSRLPQPVNPDGHKFYKDIWHGINWEFADRRNALRFRKALIDIFSGNVEYDETTDRPGGLKEDVMDFLMTDNSYIELDYYEEWVKSLSRIRVNQLYKD